VYRRLVAGCWDETAKELFFEINLSYMRQELTEKKALYPHAAWYFAAGILITWLGFSRSYFARLGANDIYHHIHGATAGAWMTLLIVQPILYHKGKFTLHRKLGRVASSILVPLLVLGGLKMMHSMMNSATFYPPGVAYQLAYADACSILFFLLFFSLSLYNSSDVHVHARYMACTILVLLPPAIVRAFFFIPWFDGFTKALNAGYLLIELALVVLLLDDRRYGPIRKPYLVALLLFVSLHLTLNLVPHWDWWHAAMDHFAAL